MPKKRDDSPEATAQRFLDKRWGNRTNSDRVFSVDLGVGILGDLIRAERRRAVRLVSEVRRRAEILEHEQDCADLTMEVGAACECGLDSLMDAVAEMRTAILGTRRKP